MTTTIAVPTARTSQPITLLKPEELFMIDSKQRFALMKWPRHYAIGPLAEPLLGTGQAVRYERLVRARALIAEITSVLASAYAFISSNS